MNLPTEISNSYVTPVRLGWEIREQSLPQAIRQGPEGAFEQPTGIIAADRKLIP